MASVGSSSASGAKAYAKASNLAIWTCKTVEFSRGLLKLSKNTEASQSALTAMPLSDHAQCFATVAGHMELHGSSGAKAYADQTMIQRSHIFRWKYVDEVADILARGPDLLNKYIFDEMPWDLFGISDSTVTFNDINNTPDASGGLMSKAYSERKSSWEGRTKQLIVLARVGGKQEHFLQLLEELIDEFCINRDPATFRGHLLMIISMNDVTLDKSHVPDSKLSFTKQIVELLKRFPLGTVSIVGPGSETNWGYKVGFFSSR